MLLLQNSPRLLILLLAVVLALPRPAAGQSAAQSATAGVSDPPQANDSLTTRLQQAQAAEQSGDPAAVAAANQALAATALRNMAELQVMQGLNAEAIVTLQRSLELDPAYQTRISLALAYRRGGRIDDALGEVDKVIAAEPKNADALNIEGALLMDKKEFARAADSFERSLALQPSPYVAYALGLAYLNLQQPAKAAGIFQQIIDSSGNSASAYIMVGRAYQNVGKMQDAAANYQKAIEIDPKNSRGHYFLGLLYLMQNEWSPDPQAREQFTAEVAENPKDFFGNFFLGYIESGDNNFEVSDRYLRVAAEAKPDWPEPWLYMGINAFGRSDTQHAEEYMRKAIALTGNDLTRNNYQIRRAYYILGRILIQRGEKEEGAADVKLFKEMEEKNMEMSRQATPAGASGATSSKARAGMRSEPSVPTTAIIDPGGQLDTKTMTPPALTKEEQGQVKAQEKQLRVILGTAFNDLGTSEARRKEYAPALAHFQEAEKWNPGTPRLMRNIGLAAFRSNNYAEAARALKLALVSDPQDKLAQSMLAMSLYSTDQFAEAAKVFDQLGDTALSDPRVAYAWAFSLAQANDPLKSAAILEKLSAQPLAPDMLLLVGQVYNAIGDNLHALGSFQKAAQQDPSLQRAHYFAGLALIRLDRPNEAIPEFEAELKLTPDEPEAQYNLAFALLETSRRDQALAILKPLVAAHPNHAMAQYQLGKVLLDDGQVNDAIPHLEAAAANNPSLDYVHYQLQMAYRKAGRTADAEREAKLYREIKDRKRDAPQSAH